MSKTVASLESRLLAMSSAVIATDTEEKDRWGGPIGMTIGAVRIGNKALLCSHAGDDRDPEFPPHNEIERLVNLNDVLSQAYAVYSDYGFDELECDVEEFITHPEELDDCRAKIGRLLNRRYFPPIGKRHKPVFSSTSTSPESASKWGNSVPSCSIPKRGVPTRRRNPTPQKGCVERRRFGILP